MKKIISSVLAGFMLISCLAACGPKTTTSEIWVEESDITFTDSDTVNQAGTDANASGATGNSGTATGSSGTGNSGGSASSKYDFMKGKTYTMAITNEPQYQTTSFKAMISAFQKKYGCKITTKTLVFNDYNKQVTQQMSSGDPFDICYMHGSMFPQGPISGIYADLTEAMTQVDTGDLNADFTSYYKYNGKQYAVLHNGSAYPYVFYYNKLMFEENGLEDPLKLYNAGKWTWDKIFEMGKEVTDKDNGIYFLCSVMMNSTGFMGVPVSTVENGKVVANFNSKAMYDTLQTVRKIYVGNDAIGAPIVDTDDETDFIKGLQFVYYQEASKYSQYAAKAAKSAAFNKDVNNLCIVPLPKTASGKYPTGYMFGIAAGEGSDPRVAVTWANFCATFKSPTKGKNEMRDSDKAICDNLIQGGIVPVHGTFATSSDDYLTTFKQQIVWKTARGEDISKAIADATPKLVACLDATLGKGNYTIAK